MLQQLYLLNNNLIGEISKLIPNSSPCELVDYGIIP